MTTPRLTWLLAVVLVNTTALLGYVGVGCAQRVVGDVTAIRTRQGNGWREPKLPTENVLVWHGTDQQPVLGKPKLDLYAGDSGFVKAGTMTMLDLPPYVFVLPPGAPWDSLDRIQRQVSSVPRLPLAAPAPDTHASEVRFGIDGSGRVYDLLSGVILVAAKKDESSATDSSFFVRLFHRIRLGIHSRVMVAVDQIHTEAQVYVDSGRVRILAPTRKDTALTAGQLGVLHPSGALSVITLTTKEVMIVRQSLDEAARVWSPARPWWKSPWTWGGAVAVGAVGYWVYNLVTPDDSANTTVIVPIP